MELVNRNICQLIDSADTAQVRGKKRCLGG